jgi:hypothetical protein
MAYKHGRLGQRGGKYASGTKTSLIPVRSALSRVLPSEKPISNREWRNGIDAQAHAARHTNGVALRIVMFAIPKRG